MVERLLKAMLASTDLPPKTGPDIVREIWHNLGPRSGGKHESKQFTTEKIIGMLREAEVAAARGIMAGKVCRQLGVSQQSCYR